jgi:hypothetical protein
LLYSFEKLKACQAIANSSPNRVFTDLGKSILGQSTEFLFTSTNKLTELNATKIQTESYRNALNYYLKSILSLENLVYCVIDAIPLEFDTYCSSMLFSFLETMLGILHILVADEYLHMISHGLTMVVLKDDPPSPANAVLELIKKLIMRYPNLCAQDLFDLLIRKLFCNIECPQSQDSYYKFKILRILQFIANLDTAIVCKY